MENLKLMKGNWVNTPDGINQIASFVDDGIHVGYGKCYKYSELKPIPLTSEILDKCPQIERETERQYRIGERLIVIRAGKFYDYGTGLHLEYLHTLQQLASLLLNQELIINL